MKTRPIHQILDEWRALERRLETEGHVDFADRLGALRAEYARAVEARQDSAAELRRFETFQVSDSTL